MPDGFRTSREPGQEPRQEPEADEFGPAAEGMPGLIDDVRTVFLFGLFMLATLAVCYAAAEIVLPIVLALILSLVFQPPLRFLERLYLPRIVAALVIVISLVALFFVIGYLLSGPIAAWITEIPKTIPKLQARLSLLSGPIKAAQRALEHLQNLAPGTGPTPIPVQNSPLSERVLSEVRLLASGAFTMVLVLFFLLIAGDRFLRRLVEILPRFQDKRQVVDIAQQIEHDISAYLATITIMNTLVGIATGIAMWLCGLGSPVLWGTIAFLLNFVPVLGPTAGVVLFLAAGLVIIDDPWLALLPPVLYLTIHVVEGETVTPMILAGRFTINPVLVIVSLIFWHWMWGVPGAILSTPMLAIAKIICDRIDRLRPVGHFIAG